MPRWMWFAPLAVLITALGAWGFRLGWIAATITETDVINHWAAHYLETAGHPARATDCVARPGQNDPVWIVVTCTAAAGERYDYAVDRFGRLLDPGSVADGAPRT